MNLEEIKNKVINFFRRPDIKLWGETSFILPFLKTDSFWIVQKTFPKLKLPQEVGKELYGKGLLVQQIERLWNFTSDNYSDSSQRWVYLVPNKKKKIIKDNGTSAMTIIKENKFYYEKSESRNFIEDKDTFSNNKEILKSPPYLNYPLEIVMKGGNGTVYYRFEGEILNGEGDYGIVQESINSTFYNQIPICLLIDGGLRRSLESYGFIVLGIEGALEMSIFKHVINLNEAHKLHKKFLTSNNRLYAKNFKEYHKKEAFEKTWLRLYKLIFKQKN